MKSLMRVVVAAALLFMANVGMVFAPEANVVSKVELCNVKFSMDAHWEARKSGKRIAVCVAS